MGILWLDARYALRGLLKRPGFSIVAVITLALGIGANTAIFSVVNAVLLMPLAYPEPEQLMALWAENMTKGLTQQPISYLNFSDLRAQSQLFENLAAVRAESYSLTDRGEPERIDGVRVSANIFDLLGITPLRGRGFLPSEDQPDKASVALISQGLWQRRYGGDKGLLGQTLTLDGRVYTIIGILPAQVKSPGLNIPATGADVWVPLIPQPNEQKRSFANMRMVGRLKPKVTREQAEAEIEAIAGRLEQQYPAENTNLGITIIPLHDYLVGSVRPALLVLLGAVGFVLAVACANVANLLLARAAGRQTEMAVRSALGANRWQLVRQLLTESVCLSLIGGLMGLLLAYCGVPLLMGLSAKSIPRAEGIGINPKVLGFTLLTALATGILFGLAPALQSSRLQLVEALKEGCKGGGGVINRRLLSGLVIVEVALALVLLVGAGLMIRSFQAVSRIDPGFDLQHVLTIAVPLPQAGYKDQAQQLAFYEKALTRLQAMPGVESAAGIFKLPIVGWATVTYTVQGQPVVEGNEPSADYRTISYDYFRAMGIRLLQGREFTAHDTVESADAVIINEEMARQYWPDENPIGKRLQIAQEKTRWREIVGVVANAKLIAIDAKVDPAIYVPFPQNTWPMALRISTIVARTKGDPKNMISAIRQELQTLDPGLPLSQIRTMEEIVWDSLAQRRFNMALLITFASLAGILAAVGIYGVMAYSVTQRTHELGIRIALGAAPSDILKMVIGEGAKLTSCGIIIGLGAAAGLTRLMSSLLYGVSATDPITFASIAICLTLVALFASYLPARKAVTVNPTTALR